MIRQSAYWQENVSIRSFSAPLDARSDLRCAEVDSDDNIHSALGVRCQERLTRRAAPKMNLVCQDYGLEDHRTRNILGIHSSLSSSFSE